MRYEIGQVLIARPPGIIGRVVEMGMASTGDPLVFGKELENPYAETRDAEVVWLEVIEPKADEVPDRVGVLPGGGALRPLMSRREAEEVLAVLMDDRTPRDAYNRLQRQAMGAVRTGTPLEIAEAIRSLALARQSQLVALVRSGSRAAEPIFLGGNMLVMELDHVLADDRASQRWFHGLLKLPKEG